MINDSSRLNHNQSGYEKGIFSEEDRKKIRQCLTLFKDKKYPSLKTTKTVEKKENNKKPSITEKVYRKHFSWKSFPEELDEVPMIFLIRLHLWPYLINKTSIELEPLQFLCEMSGIASIVLDQGTEHQNAYTMNGFIANGGPIDKCTFHLSYKNKKNEVVIDELIFHRKE
tara:strand:- start:4258 stop:4767 length:510 start_codon:yes stop_codon:yes gene_type:complete